MFGKLKAIGNALFGIKSDTTAKTIIDSRFGKLTCESKPDDRFYFWDGILTTLNRNPKSETAISIDGDINGPFSKSLDLLLWITQNISGINSEVQQKASDQFPDATINLADYTIADISIYNDTDGDFEMEYDSDESGLLSVNIKDGKVLKMELY